MQFGMIRNGDVAIRWREDGPAEAPTIAFANSLGTDLQVWDRLVPLLADRFRLLRYDKRGHGLSSVPPAPYRMSEHVGDLAALLDARGVETAVVVGLSVGGLIALGLAGERPDLVRALVLSDTAPKIGDAETWNSRLASIRAGGPEAQADATMTRWFTEAMRDARQGEVAMWRNMLTRTPLDGYLGTGEAIRDTDYWPIAKALKVPVLCVVGEEDGSTPPELVRSVAAGIPGARFELIAGAGHLPCVEQPETLARLLGAFCDGLPA